MFVPKSYGGLDVDFPTSMEMIEALAAANGSVGWVVMIGCETPMLLALLDAGHFDRLYANGPDVIIGGAFAPRGTAEVVDGGYRVSGRWAFASGCQHSQWLFGNCVVTEGGRPRPGAIPGQPEARAMMFAPTKAQIIDTWSVNGLRGTGSHDIAVENVRVPAEDSLDIFMGQSSIAGPLYAAHLAYFALHIAAVGIGIAKRTLREIIALAATSKQRLYASASMVDTPLFQYRIGNADLTLRAARALLMDEANKIWSNAVAGNPLLPNDQIRATGTVAWVSHTAATIVDTCYTAGGGSAPYDASPLQRCLRDIHTLTQHAAAAEGWITRAGAVLLGQPGTFSV